MCNDFVFRQTRWQRLLVTQLCRQMHKFILQVPTHCVINSLYLIRDIFFRGRAKMKCNILITQYQPIIYDMETRKIHGEKCRKATAAAKKIQERITRLSICCMQHAQSAEGKDLKRDFIMPLQRATLEQIYLYTNCCWQLYLLRSRRHAAAFGEERSKGQLIDIANRHVKWNKLFFFIFL